MTMDMSRLVSELTLAVVDTSEDLKALTGAFSGQAEHAQSVRDSADEVASLNQQIAASAARTDEDVQQAHDAVQVSADTIARSVDAIERLSGHVTNIANKLVGLEDTLGNVARAAATIEMLARRTDLLAVNAAIEAAHAGESGRGFAVVAEEVKRLANKTTEATTEIHSVMKSFRAQSDDLRNAGTEADSLASSVRENTTLLTTSVTGLKTTVDSVFEQAREIRHASEQIQDRSSFLRDSIASLADGVTSASRNLESGRERMTTLTKVSHSLVQLSANDDRNLTDQPFIRAVQEAAQHVAAQFEDAVKSGRISIEDLFDQTYTPIPGTDPQQVMAKHTRLTDQVMPVIQEPLLERLKGAVFCAAVDVNGYLATHNKKFSQPQGRDPVWNNANCRNRRIFNDPVGLLAGRNTQPFVVSVYRRDMGGGHFVMMKDVSAPIYVRGRHWGGFRMGYKTS